MKQTFRQQLKDDRTENHLSQAISLRLLISRALHKETYSLNNIVSQEPAFQLLFIIPVSDNRGQFSLAIKCKYLSSK
jgi:hypothetical protein